MTNILMKNGYSAYSISANSYEKNSITDFNLLKEKVRRVESGKTTQGYSVLIDGSEKFL